MAFLGPPPLGGIMATEKVSGGKRRSVIRLLIIVNKSLRLFLDLLLSKFLLGFLI